MNNVIISAEEVEPPAWSNRASGFALKILEDLNLKDWELSVVFCGDETMKRLNKQYRNKDESTDILSFSLGDNMGDIVISLETLRENSKYFNVSEDEELQRLLIHGILHLSGMDHETLDNTEPMLILQEELLTKHKGVLL